MLLTRDKTFYKSFFRLMSALMLQQAVVLSVNLADNIMLGSYSETALSGVAAVNQIQFILQQLVFGISNGMVVLASQYWGQKKTEPVRRLMALAFWAAIAVAALLFSLVSLFPHGAVGIFTEDEAIIGQGVNYLSVVRFSYLFFAVTTVLLGTMRIVEKVSIALYVSVIALLLNCAINYTLIKGRFGFPELGARGAAIGTLTARVVECLIVVFYVLYRDKLLRVRIRDFLRIDSLLAKDYVRVSLPVVTTGFLWGCNTALQTVILGHMSSSAIAAHSISSTIFLFLKVMAVGASSAAAVLTGKTVGTGNLPKIREYTRTFQVLFLCIGVLLGTVLFLIRIPLLGLYTLEPRTRELANAFILIESTVLMVMSYQMCMNTGVICGGGDTRYVMIMDLIVIWCIVIPLSFASAFLWNASPVVVLLVLNADQYLKCIPAAVYGNSFRWIRLLTRPADEDESSAG
ncbi:MAG: MATE family efflux transporter [Lachnospiraceae bacterium]|nr:MATE family efflux transporter [Lachnospiraceae bacterium]